MDSDINTHTHGKASHGISPSLTDALHGFFHNPSYGCIMPTTRCNIKTTMEHDTAMQKRSAMCDDTALALRICDGEKAVKKTSKVFQRVQKSSKELERVKIHLKQFKTV